MGGIPIPVSTLSYPPGRMHWYRYGCEPSHCSVCGVTINQSINHITVHDLLTRRGIRLWDSEEQHHRSMMITNAIWYNRQCICEAHSIWTFVRYNMFKQNMQTINEYNQVVSDQVVCALLSILHCSKYFATAFMFRLFLSRNPATVCVSDVKVCENKHEKLLRKLS